MAYEPQVGDKVRHRVSRKEGIVTEVDGEDCILSYGLDETARVATVALEKVDEDGPGGGNPYKLTRA